jgi:hypothetical protein
MANVSIIVMEKGSEWPGQVGECQSLLAVGACDEHETLQRTRERLEWLRHHDHQVRVAVLACSEATDPASAARRAAVAHELFGVVRATVSGRLVLAGTDHASMQARRELLGLAGALSDRLGGTSATVSVRFGSPGNPPPGANVRR